MLARLLPGVLIWVLVACTQHFTITAKPGHPGVVGSVGDGKTGAGPSSSVALQPVQLAFVRLPPRCTTLQAPGIAEFGAIQQFNAAGSPVPFTGEEKMSLQVCDSASVTATGCTPVSDTLFATQPSAAILDSRALTLTFSGAVLASGLKPSSTYLIAQSNSSGGVLQSPPVMLTLGALPQCSDASHVVLGTPLPPWPAGGTANGPLTLTFPATARAPTGVLVTGVTADGRTVSFGPELLKGVNFLAGGGRGGVSVTLATPNYPTAGLIFSLLGADQPMQTAALPLPVVAGAPVKIAAFTAEPASTTPIPMTLYDNGPLDVSSASGFQVAGGASFLRAQFLDALGNPVNASATTVQSVSGGFYAGSGCSGNLLSGVKLSVAAPLQILPHLPDAVVSAPSPVVGGFVGFLTTWPQWSELNVTWSSSQPIVGAASLELASSELGGGLPCLDFFSAGAIATLAAGSGGVSGVPATLQATSNAALSFAANVKVVLSAAHAQTPEAATVTLQAFSQPYCNAASLMSDFFLPGTTVTADLTFGVGASNEVILPQLQINPVYLNGTSQLVFLAVASSNPHLASSTSTFALASTSINAANPYCAQMVILPASGL